MKKILLAPIVVLLMLFICLSANAQCGSHHKKSRKASAVRVHYNNAPSDDIVSIAINSPVHTTLVAAVKAAGLVSTLQGDGPFTVFAPTNDYSFGLLYSCRSLLKWSKTVCKKLKIIPRPMKI